MRAADDTPPSRRPRSSRPVVHRLVSLVLLIALVVTVLPTDRLMGAQPDPPTGTPTLPASNVTEPLPVASPPVELPETATADAPGVTAGASFPSPEISASPLPPEPTRPSIATNPNLSSAEPATLPAGASGTSEATTQPGTDGLVAPTEPAVTIADASLPVACQVVLGVTTVAPAPGVSVRDRFPDPIAGAAFTVAVGTRGTFTLITDANGLLNLVTQVFTGNGQPVAAGDTVTVSQVSTRTGLTLGDPAFVASFAWQPAYASSCRVEAFVINPASVVTPPSPSSGASADASPSPVETPTATPSPTASPSPIMTMSPTASPSPTVSPSPDPTPSPVVTSTTAPTATTAPTIPVGFGRVEVWAVASRAPDAPAGQAPVRLSGARFVIVERQNRTLVATLTTGEDGTVQSPLLPLGTYDLILDAPPPRYLSADARGFSVSSPTLQTFVFTLTADPNPPPTSTPTVAPPSLSPTASVSPSLPPTGTPTVTPRASIRATSTPIRTATSRATATRRATTTATPSATATRAPSIATRAPRSTTSAVGTATPRPATATIRPSTATATIRPTTATATIRPSTATATIRPSTVGPTTTVASSPSRAPRIVSTASPTVTPRPAVTSAATTTTQATSTPIRTPRNTATAQGSPTQPGPNQQSRVTVEVVICIDPRFAEFGEFGSVTDLGPRYLTDIDRSRCRAARIGEVRVSLSGAATVYSPAVALTGATDAAGRITFIVANTLDRRAAALHLDGPIPALDAGVLLTPGLNLTIPLTVVIRDPAAPPIGGATTGAASGPTTTAGPAGGSAIMAALALLLLIAFATRRLTRPAAARRRGAIR